jgi:hypothetical protein
MAIIAKKLAPMVVTISNMDASSNRCDVRHASSDAEHQAQQPAHAGAAVKHDKTSVA